MINVNNLTEKELIDQYWHSDDPVVSRLCRIVDRYHQMSQYLPREVEYCDDLGWHVDNTPLDQYISDLKSDRDFYEQETYDLQDKVKKLSARTVAELLGFLESKLCEKEHKINKLCQDLESAQKREKLAQEKLDMWTIISRENTT